MSVDHLELTSTAVPSQALLARISAQLEQSQTLFAQRIGELNDKLARADSERAQQLAEQQRLASRLQSLLDILPSGVVVLDGLGVVREANPLALSLLGQPLLGCLWREVIQRAFAPRADDGHEISLLDGRRVSIATRSLPGEPGQLLLLSDLTETRRLQEQLAQHQQLSALGRMVASLAHQIRTPLSAALLYAGHLHERELTFEQQSRFAGHLKERLHELEHQVRDMLVFARGELPLRDQLKPTHFFRALQRAAETHVLGVAVRWQCDVHEGWMLCNRDTLIGAALNLLKNAQQASRGALRLKIHLYRRGDQLRLAVSDNGEGIAPEVQGRLADAFFTTRTTGTGLGLSVVQAVVKAHQGQIQVRSKVGRGTVVTLLLPWMAEAKQSIEG